MHKKTITFEDYSEPPQEVTETFYFNFNKLEVIEMLELEDLEETVKRLTETENNKEAYGLFKKLILRAYGKKAPDGRGFEKEDPDGRPYSRELEASPALSEIIFEFLQYPERGGKFMEECLPPRLVAEAKAAQAKNPTNEQVAQMVQEASKRPDGPVEVAPAIALPKVFHDYTREELVTMPNEQFQALVPADPKDMTQDQLLVAFQRKNK